MSLSERYRRAAALLYEHRDLIEERSLDGAPTSALVRRGWDAALLALSDDEVETLERDGADAPLGSGLPRWLRSLALEAREVSRVDRLLGEDGGSEPRRRHEKARKALQIDALVELVRPLAARAPSIVDVGSGHGHLTREIASRLGRAVTGLERSPALAERARALGRGTPASFEALDVVANGLDVGPGDLVIGLHACGELGDVMVARAAEAGARLVLASCCLQKRRADVRLAMSRRHLSDFPAGALDWPRRILGLSNLGCGDVGVERSRRENLDARRRRHALSCFLEARSVLVDPGAELAGKNRRAAHRSFDQLVSDVAAERRLSPPTRAEIAEAEARGAERHARARRLELPRALLARPLEVGIALDRALHLEDAGASVRLGTAFPTHVSARNLVVLAERA